MDKFVLVTNANTQIGNELVKKLISENFIVFAGDESYENKKFGNLIYLTLDSKNYKSIENAKKNIQKYTSKINVIVNLTNHITYSSLIECSEEQMLESIEMNYMSAFRVNQVLWDMLEVKTGKIIHDCSDVSIFELVPFNGVYSIAKSILKNYNDVLRRELKYKGISVVRVHTGLVKDNTYDMVKERYHTANDSSKLIHDEMGRFINLNISKGSLISVNEYCEFMAKIVKAKIIKKAYFYKVNKSLSYVSKLPNYLKDLYFKNYQR